MKEDKYIRNVQSIIIIVMLLVSLLLFAVVHLYNTPFGIDEPSIAEEQALNHQLPLLFNDESKGFWSPLDLANIQGSTLENQILYGKELIAHTSKYLGPNGSVAQISNGLNCQNCHLDAGTKIYGNNYGSVNSTYPKFRARSGKTEDMYKRVNDCFERSLNGTALDTLSPEMQAIKAYMLFLGKNVVKGTKVKGSGFKNLAYLDRRADVKRGSSVYIEKCASCHQKNGEGIMAASNDEYTYPPLWGPHSYNDGAGLFRVSNFAKYAKYNMPFGVSHNDPQLTDEESWDVAAFVNSQPRPHLNADKDWPDFSKKPIDHPFPPYNDTFSTQQHKYGPFKPIVAAKAN